MASITLNAVSKTYSNDVQAVDDVSLDIADGELMVLVGPSGCGKTTLMRMISGLERVTAGQIKIGDRDVTMAAPKERDVAMVFQNYALYPHMTVAENIGFPLRLRGVGKREIATKVAAATEILGLSQSESRRPPELSGGQRQRVAMGRAIVREPSVFLMDEPLSNLDAKLRVEMRSEILNIQRRVGVATVYVTHDQTEAMTMGDRVAVLEAGRLLQCDVPQTIYDEPANVTVAAFIGSPAMNLFEGTLGADGTLRIGEETLTLEPATLPSGLRGAGEHPVIFGVRPEDLRVAGEGDSFITGTVELVEALGSDLLVHMDTSARRAQLPEFGGDDELPPEAEVSGRGRFVARLEPRAGVRIGDTLRLTPDPARTHFFDPASGQKTR
ncbi:MAG TPA: sn-glycerol-3-phosphate ABC transporter ATP-binding protein UgpC [Solirubrobacteraceae bacterium]|nr:sn-glycerol-3-phosphate ABC transporter ATP-binding protein UgpC [Solirubrobacteraceae bacterium]